ncbi:MAG: hypothetical protein WCX28_10675 [Bacteriovoracaceae bacterium]|nr:hypothetical protein [Bacteroidota bacterium]
MSIKYICDKKKKLTISVWHHHVTFEQWKKNVEKLLADPDFIHTNKQIVDIHIGSADISIGEEEIKQVLQYILKHPELVVGRKIAIIAGKEFHRSTMFTHFARSQSLNTIVFNDLHTACKWLGIDRQEAELTIEQIRKDLDRSTQ